MDQKPDLRLILAEQLDRQDQYELTRQVVFKTMDKAWSTSDDYKATLLGMKVSDIAIVLKSLNAELQADESEALEQHVEAWFQAKARREKDAG